MNYYHTKGYLPLSSYLNLLLSQAPFGCNYAAYALPYRCDESEQVFLCNLVPLLLNYLLYLFIYTRLIATLSNILLYYLLKSFNQVEIRAIWGLIKQLDLVSRESSFNRLNFIYKCAIYLYNKQSRIKRLVGINTYIILPIIVFMEVLQAQVDIILKALSCTTALFLFILKDQRLFLNTCKISLNYCIRYIIKS